MGELADRAREFARERHGDQMYGSYPYVKHLDDVVNVLIRFGHGDDESLLAAAFLHDVVEDTPTTLAEVREAFGDMVASYVHAVTNEHGRNRMARHLATYPKIAGKYMETILKLADRIANTEESARSNPGLASMYLREWDRFKEALGMDGDPTMWMHLDFVTKGGWNGKPI